MPLRAASILKSAVLVFGLGALNAQAQAAVEPQKAPAPVYYRCGPQGQDLRDSPCPAGQAGRAVDLPKDSVDPAEAAAARQRAGAEARDAAAAQREQARQAARPAGPAGIRGTTGAASATKGSVPKPADPKKRKPKDPKTPKPKPAPKPAPPPKVPKVPKAPKPSTITSALLPSLPLPAARALTR